MRRVLALMLLGLAVDGCGSETVTSPARTLVIPNAHVSLRYPVGWHAIRRPVSASNATQELVTIASFHVRPHGRPPTAGGLLILYDDGTSGVRNVPSRPERFVAPGRPRAGALGCLDIPWAGYSLIFRDHGRAFQAFVGLGSRATVRTKMRLLGVLDSLKVSTA